MIVIIIVAAGSTVGHDAALLQAFTNLSLAGAAIATMIVNDPPRARRVTPALRSSQPAQSGRQRPNASASPSVGSSKPPRAAEGGVR